MSSKSELLSQLPETMTFNGIPVIPNLNMSENSVVVRSKHGVMEINCGVQMYKQYHDSLIGLDDLKRLLGVE